MDGLNKPYNPKDTEDKIYETWEESGFFNPDRLPKSFKLQTFCIVVPPPNITGSLHMGHALNATIQDILIRKKRMEGYKTLWLPGTDHAGIATQNVVEKMLRKDGITRHDLGREKFLEKIWEWKEKYGHIIPDQFKKLGSSMDWSRARFTMDPEYQKAVSRAFIYYYQKGWIYRANRVINWCPRCLTSLSDLELEYKESDSVLYYLKYPLAEGGGAIIVATVRPETMLGDAAVAVNPKDARYKHLVGKKILLPIQNREIPVIADSAVDLNFGTGAVKVTPAHDFADAEIGERHRLPSMQVIDQYGKMTVEAGANFAGLKATDARAKIVADLKLSGLLVKEEPYKHNLSVCSRCSAAIEPMPSTQWFLRMEKLALRAVKAVKSGKVKFHPKRWEKVYFDWLKNIRDWTISRQIWWGHRLPVFFCKRKPEKFLNSIPTGDLPKGDNFSARGGSAFGGQISNNEYVVADKKPAKCPFCENCEMEQSADVLDTWFSSALWPFATLGWPSSVPPKAGLQKSKPAGADDLKKFYPTQVLSTARDIINLWVARMIFSGKEFMGREPFSDVIIHATILTKDGRRMSKSLGTGIDPLELIEKYGADATRFGLIWQAMGGQDIHWSEEHVMAGKKFANKIWNAARYALAQLSVAEYHPSVKLKPKTPADKKIIDELKKVRKKASVGIDKYEFGSALHILYDFFWHEFCDKYIEASKKQMDDPKLWKTTSEILVRVMSASLKLLHPFMPFITEKIWQNIPPKNKKLLIVEDWSE